MTAALEPVGVATASLDHARTVLSDLTARIQALHGPAELREARAGIEAVKAWAKAHGDLRRIRLDLLRVEVDLLLRVAELDQLDHVSGLSALDRKAATWLAAMTPTERERLLRESGTATTAAGMCRSVWLAEENQRLRRANFDVGQSRAEDPSVPNADLAIAAARDRIVGVHAALADVLDRHVGEGESFTIEDLADEVLQSAGTERSGIDEGILEGVREICRRAVRKTPVVKFKDTVLPRLVTTRTDDGKYIRIPVENALMSNLDDMITLRREQISADQAALAQLVSVAQRLREVPGCTDVSRIGELIALSVLPRRPSITKGSQS